MSYGIEIHDELTPFNEALKAGLQPGSINPPVGAAVVLAFQNHFLELSPNKQGWASTNFWSRCAKATHFNLLAEGVLISVSQVGARQRLEGGDIRPVNHTYLTIPATEAAYGHTAREFKLKFAIVNDNGFQRPALVAQRSVASQVTKTKTGKYKHTADEVGQVVFYWLVRQVHQEPDPNTIPPEDEIRATIGDTVQGIVDRATRRAGRA